MSATSDKSQFLLIQYFISGLIVLMASYLVKIKLLTNHEILKNWHYLGIVILFVCFAITYFIKKFHKRSIWELILYLATFFGLWYLFFLILPKGMAIISSSIFILLYFFYRTVWLHNLFLVIGIAGLAINFSFLLRLELLLVLLAFFTINDFYRRSLKENQEYLVNRLLSHGLIPGMLIVREWRELLVSIDKKMEIETTEQRKLVMLQSIDMIDLIIPLTLVSRAGMMNIWYGIFVLTGALVGLKLYSNHHATSSISSLSWMSLGAVLPFLLLLASGLL